MPDRAARLPPSDPLGLRRAGSDRMLPLLVGAMAFLAALALAGVVAAAGLAQRWQQGAAASLTVQVPEPGENRLPRVIAALRATPGVAEARPLGSEELQALLRPWLGAGAGAIALPLPAVVAVRLTAPDFDDAALAARLQAAAPGTLVESQDVWTRRLAALARSIQVSAALAIGVVGAVAVAVVGVAIRAGLAARRDAIEILHGLGGTDGFIANRFARRAMRLAAGGALAGAVTALPVLLGLAALAAPLAGRDAPGDADSLIQAMPAALWASLPALPVLAALIGWTTAQITVRRWLRRLP